MTVELAGERVELDPERALVWGRVVVVADLHFGKDASARARAIAVPPGATEASLARLDVVLDRHRAEELWMLGDVFDSEHAADPGTVSALCAWRARHAARRVAMVAGNHDLRAAGLAETTGFDVLPALAEAGPWRLAHHPGESPGGHVLCGHLHPGLRLAGPGRQRLTLPAFILGARRSILPAFGEFTGCAGYRLQPGERGYVIAGSRILDARRAVRA